MAHVARSGKRNADGKEHVAKIPKASELPDATAHTTMDFVKPPGAVAHKLGERNLAIVVDIETADWIDQKYPLHDFPTRRNRSTSVSICFHVSP